MPLTHNSVLVWYHNKKSYNDALDYSDNVTV